VSGSGPAALKALAPTLSVGVLSADLMRLGEQLEAVAAAGARLLHFDVLDGRFAPGSTVGAAFVGAVRTPLLKDLHLMVEEPAPAIPAWVAAGADLITVHVEACRDPRGALRAIGEAVNRNEASRGVARGLAANPVTPVEAIEPFLEECDVVWLLAVPPGLPGQRFIHGTFDRMQDLRRRIARAGGRVLLGVDGGINAANVGAVAAAGADLIVSGSALFAGGRIAENGRALFEAVAAGASAAS